MYVIPPSSHLAVSYQGDILKEFPFLDLSNPQPVSDEDESLIRLDGSIQESSLAVINVEKRKVMLLSQTCDAGNREHLILCPIYSIEEYIASDQPNADKLRSIREGKLYYWFYLPEEIGIIEESFVDFQQFFYVPRSTYNLYGDGNKILQLNDLGRHRLTWAISSYFGRPI